jgi:hypothetical protein
MSPKFLQNSVRHFVQADSDTGLISGSGLVGSARSSNSGASEFDSWAKPYYHDWSVSCFFFSPTKQMLWTRWVGHVARWGEEESV